MIFVLELRKDRSCMSVLLRRNAKMMVRKNSNTTLVHCNILLRYLSRKGHDLSTQVKQRLAISKLRQLVLAVISQKLLNRHCITFLVDSLICLV